MIVVTTYELIFKRTQAIIQNPIVKPCFPFKCFRGIRGMAGGMRHACAHRQAQVVLLLTFFISIKFEYLHCFFTGKSIAEFTEYSS